MKKMLTMLALAAMPVMLGGCASCCPTGLCPCCPCNWFNRAPACPPAPCPPAPMYAAPLAASPCAPPMCASAMPQQQFAAPYTAMPSIVQPTSAACCQQQQAMPMYFPQAMQAQPAYYSEAGCGVMEASCGSGFPGMVSYGPEMPMEYGPPTSGCCESGVASPPSPEPYIEPRPAGE
jgi:hypothetical protein